MTELDLIPVLCRRALDDRLSPSRMRRGLAGAREALAGRRARLDDLQRTWARWSLTRAEVQSLREAVAEGRREVEGLERCLQHLHRWSWGGARADLQRAMVAYDGAQTSWRRHLRAVLSLAPAMSCREYRA